MIAFAIWFLVIVVSPVALGLWLSGKDRRDQARYRRNEQRNIDAEAV